MGSPILTPETRVNIEAEAKRKEAETPGHGGGGQGPGGCLRSILTFLFGSRVRSLTSLSLIWCLVTGPWAGLLAAAAWEESRYQFPCLATCLMFLASQLILLSPDSR